MSSSWWQQPGDWITESAITLVIILVVVAAIVIPLAIVTIRAPKPSHIYGRQQDGVAYWVKTNWGYGRVTWWPCTEAAYRQVEIGKEYWLEFAVTRPGGFMQDNQYRIVKAEPVEPD